MAVLQTSNPVTTVAGVVNNLFAGFDKVEFGFKREDAQINGVGQGINNQLLIQTQSDLSSYLSVGDSVFVYSEGLQQTYSTVGQVVETTTTTLTITGDFIETTSTGYINYLKNWYLEADIVNPDNSDIKLLPFTLKDDGDNAGNVIIDVGIVNDLNELLFEFTTQEQTVSRQVFKVQYREVYDSAPQNYTLIDQEIILVYATEQPVIEEFAHNLDEPKLWKGYPFGVVLNHSNENSDDTAIDFSYDELDINQANLVLGNSLGQIPADKQGKLFIDIDKSNTYNANTEYIRLNASYSGLAFFDPAFFDNSFFDA